MIRRLSVTLILLAAVFASALELVITRHESRANFVELQDLRKAKARLDEEWSVLLLEQATWATHGRVETIAREKLKMVAPPEPRAEPVDS